MLKNLTTITTVKCWYRTTFDSNPLRFQASIRRLNFLFLPSRSSPPFRAPRSKPGPAVTSQPISWKPLTSQTRGPRVLWPHRWLGPTRSRLAPARRREKLPSPRPARSPRKVKGRRQLTCAGAERTGWPSPGGRDQGRRPPPRARLPHLPRVKEVEESRSSASSRPIRDLLSFSPDPGPGCRLPARSTFLGPRGRSAPGQCAGWDRPGRRRGPPGPYHRRAERAASPGPAGGAPAPTRPAPGERRQAAGGGGERPPWPPPQDPDRAALTPRPTAAPTHLRSCPGRGLARGCTPRCGGGGGGGGRPGSLPTAEADRAPSAARRSPTLAPKPICLAKTAWRHAPAQSTVGQGRGRGTGGRGVQRLLPGILRYCGRWARKEWGT